MKTKTKNNYDVIVVGAGIGGLVTGCYLAKAGLKTLIIEKNARPGGYCMSFSRKGFIFDACAHSLSSLRKGGILFKAFEELGVDSLLETKRNNPSDVIITSDCKINIYSDLDETIKEFSKTFPKDSTGIVKFFKYISTSTFIEIRSKTFEAFINSYFSEQKLKDIFLNLTKQVLGYSPSYLSAAVVCILWREFFLDGGYYPVKGMQALPDALIDRYIEFGGEVAFSETVKKIGIKNNKASGVLTKKGLDISAKYIVSACDIRQTFSELIDKSSTNEPFVNKLASLNPSLSAFMVYLGINNPEHNLDLRSNTWILDGQGALKQDFNIPQIDVRSLVLTSPSSKKTHTRSKLSLCLATIAPFNHEISWDDSFREEVGNKLCSNAQKYFPDLFKSISLRITASPLTLFKWTNNYMGAAYGWASTPAQFGNPDISQQTIIGNLYLAGHWSNMSSGIVSVVNCSIVTKNIILRKEHINP